jgi:periplasmic copper chaperone A
MKKLFVSFALLAAAPAFAQVSATDAWTRATVPVQKVAGVFLTLQSAQATALVAVDSPVAGHVEIHEMSVMGEMMRMRQIQRLELPAGKPVALKPGGYHLMLFDLKKPLQAGEIVPLTLRFEGGRSVEVKAAVK